MRIALAEASLLFALAYFCAKKCGSDPGGRPLPRGKGVVGGTTPRLSVQHLLVKHVFVGHLFIGYYFPLLLPPVPHHFLTRFNLTINLSHRQIVSRTIWDSVIG